MGHRPTDLSDDPCVADLRAVIGVMPEASAIVGLDGRIVALNDSARQMLGAPTHLRRVVSDPGALVRFLRRCAGVGQLVPGRLFLRRADGSPIECKVEGARLGRPGREPLLVLRWWRGLAGSGDGHRVLSKRLQALDRAAIGRQRKVSTLRRQRSEAVIRASRDPLTGLLNRRAFDQQILRRWQGAPSKVALLMIDIDHFKPFNDTHGHTAGDAALAAVARAGAAALRPDDLLARFGGEEFVALLPGAGLAGARNAAQRLNEAIRRIDGLARAVTVSIGIAAATTDAVDAKQLIDRADTALYRAKEAGRDRACYWCPERDGA